MNVRRAFALLLAALAAGLLLAQRSNRDEPQRGAPDGALRTAPELARLTPSPLSPQLLEAPGQRALAAEIPPNGEAAEVESATPHGDLVHVADLRARGGCPGCVTQFDAEPGSDPEPNAAAEPMERWAARHQAPDGRWPSTPTAGCSCDVGANHAPGDPRLDLERTALMLVSFTAGGHTHRAGPYKRTVRRGLVWLRAQQDLRGWIGAPLDPQTSARNHALGLFALAEAYATSHDFRLRDPVVAALGVCERELLQRLDELPPATVGWLLVALSAVQRSGLELELQPESLPALRARTSLADGTPTGLAVALAAAYAAPLEGDSPEEFERHAQRLAGLLPPEWTPGSVDFEAWFFAGRALKVRRGASWNTWRRQLEEALLNSQRRGDCAEDSWDPIGVHGAAGGRAWSYALGCLCLEFGYRMDRSYSRGE